MCLALPRTGFCNVLHVQNCFACNVHCNACHCCTLGCSNKSKQDDICLQAAGNLQARNCMCIGMAALPMNLLSSWQLCGASALGLLSDDLSRRQCRCHLQRRSPLEGRPISAILQGITMTLLLEAHTAILANSNDVICMPSTCVSCTSCANTAPCRMMLSGRMLNGVLHRTGAFVRELAYLPLAEDIPIAFNSCRKGPRALGWRSDQPAELSWIECQVTASSSPSPFSHPHATLGIPLFLCIRVPSTCIASTLGSVVKLDCTLHSSG